MQWLYGYHLNLFIGLFALGLVGLFALLYIDRLSLLQRLTQHSFINVVMESWNRISNDRSLVRVLSALTIANLLVTTGLLYYALLALDQSVTFFSLIYLTALQSLNLFVKITPGNMGISEGILIFGSRTLGIDISIVLLASVIMRATSVMSIVTIAPLSFYALFGRDWRKILVAKS